MEFIKCVIETKDLQKTKCLYFITGGKTGEIIIETVIQQKSLSGCENEKGHYTDSAELLLYKYAQEKK